MDHSRSPGRSFTTTSSSTVTPQSHAPPQQASGQQKPPGSDVKPRLTKEQHDILEHQFQQQHKPTTNIKKGYAKDLNVTLDKINNWFQNRRAKVKQDRKKQANQQNMQLTMYGLHQQVQAMPGHYQPHASQPQLPMAIPMAIPMPMPMHQEYFPATTEMAHTSLPVQSIEAPAVLDMGPQMPMQQQHHPNMHHSLRSIPEANRPMFHQNTVMHQIMAATHDASQPHGMVMNEPAYPYDVSGLPNTFANDNVFPMPVTESAIHGPFNSFADIGTVDYSALSMSNTNTSGSVEARNSNRSSESSPLSCTQSSATGHSNQGPTPPAVASLTSVYTGWTENPNQDVEKQEPEYEDGFGTPYNLAQASASEQTLSTWGQAGAYDMFSQPQFYRQHNASAQAVLPGQDQQDEQEPVAPYLDYEAPSIFHDDVFARRGSSTSNLAVNIEAIHIRNGTPDDFKQPLKPSLIATRRQKRPAALNSSAIRSASYSAGMHSAGMPSPISKNDHTLRRIRSSGISNTTGRIQKSQPGSAQRSPMVANFTDAAASPKFARTFSTSHTVGPGGSLAPPTPQTPQDGTYWQHNTVIRRHPVMPEHSSPESLNTNWSAEPQSAGIYSRGISPTTTPSHMAQINTMQISNENGYHHSPPQSAPPTQQNFPVSSVTQSPQSRTGYYSTNDLTIAEPKPSHFRRPSLPDSAQNQADNGPTHYSYYGGQMDYNDLRNVSLDGISHNLPFAPHHSFVPDYIVQPDGSSQMMNPYSHVPRRTTEPQPRSYIFANQGPGDFNS